MANFAPHDSFESLKDRVSSTIKSYFPLDGKVNQLVATKVWVDDNADIDDIHSQKEAKLRGRSWTVPVRAELELKDKATGKVIDRQVVNIAQLPKITRRYSYIVNGSEWQVNNLFRLKSGVYTRVKANGELASQWNLAKGLGFEMKFDPKNKQMTLKHVDKGTHVPLYPVLKAMGVDDDTIERSWGKDILSANQSDVDKGVQSFFKSVKGKNPESAEEARKFVVEELGKTVLRPDSTKITLGKPYDSVTGPALLAGANKIIQVSRGEVVPDDRDSLEFKDLFSAEDMLNERLNNWKTKSNLARKMTNTLDKQSRVRNIVSPDIFGTPIKKFFTSGLSERPDQMNPVSFLEGNRKTTLIAPGEGGIRSTHQVSIEAQSINPSHLGFLDPINTPESDRIGTSLQLASSVKKVGQEMYIPVYNVATGKKEMINPGKALKSNLAFPDQYTWKGGQPSTTAKMVKISDPDGTITVLDPKKVDYILTSSKGMFDIPSNMIPFLQSNQGNRTMMATRQMVQAVPLVSREAPLVQTKSDSAKTWEKAIGEFTSHVAKASGTVEKVTKDGIIIRDKKGMAHEVQLYNDFPLNDDRSVINSNALVKKGDEVKVGQVVADSNFTRNGTLSLGTNLKIAYMPYKGYNYDDGIVISADAAKKLTSEHMFRESVAADGNSVLNKKKFISHTAGQMNNEQADKLDDDAVVMEGQIVHKDDVLIGLLREEHLSPEQKKLSLISKGLVSPMKAREVRWTKDTPGEVTRVVKQGKDTTVYVKAHLPAMVGDKIVGRHGNKGIITAVLSQNEMPHTSDGKPVEVLLNPSGVPSRINVGQVMEVAAAKLAEKKGSPYIVNNFDPTNKDYTRNLQKELVAAGVSDTEDIVDPITGKIYKNVLTGPQYILKLHHMAEKGLSVRSRDAYDSNMLPRQGGPKGGQTMDAMGMYALLAHNARENIREMQTLKSDMNDEFWARLQRGDNIPTPKAPFVFHKFEGYLKGMGIDMKKDGNDLILQPLTDAKVLEMSNGVLNKPELALRSKDAKPEAGGIFDPKVTGTEWPAGKMGNKWSHIVLSDRIPNPVFEDPIASLLNLNQNTLPQVIRGERDLDGETGPGAVVSAIGRLDTDKMRMDLEKAIPNLRSAKLNKARKQLKYLRALDRSELTSSEAYTMGNVPVLPPVYRPLAMRPSGDISYDDTNRLYNHIGTINKKLKEFDKGLPIEEKTPLQVAIYDGVKALTLTGQVHQGRHRNSIMEMIAGRSDQQPKEGFFQDKIIGRRQDLSMRGVIVPEPSLSLDEVGLPRKAARDLYKPFTVRQLVLQGNYNPLEAQKMVDENHPAAIAALEQVVQERPVILKRDPVLHKYGVLAFRPKLMDGKAIKIHPLATSGYNADFDGDKMGAFVPVSTKAVREAYKMLPSNNLFNPSTGFLMFKPTQESMLGLYKLTEIGKNSKQVFHNAADAARAVADGKVGINDLISLESIEKSLEKVAAAPTKTTMGRWMIFNALPTESQDAKILTDLNYRLDKKTLGSVLTDVAKLNPKDYGNVADRLKDMGNENATGLSISLNDFVSDHVTRDRLMLNAGRKEGDIRRQFKDPVKRNQKVVDLYVQIGRDLNKETKANAEVSGNRMYDWVRSGAKGNWDQFRQMTVAPMLVADSRGNPVPIPIGKSYSEGLDISSYMASMHGARMGTIGKVQGTQAPGSMGKQLMQSTMNQIIAADDCGTTRGILLPIEDRDILDRYTAAEVSLGVKGGVDKGNIPAGTLVTPDILNRLKNNKIPAISVRTPLKCSHGKGLCAKCYGVMTEGNPPPKGTNIGVMAAHALAEPATQLAMNCNAAGNLVTVRKDGELHVLTFEQLWEDSNSYVDEDQGVETKIPLGLEVWDHDEFTPVHVMQRHMPHSPMVLIRTKSGHSFITQDTHPNWVRKDASACPLCGCEEPVRFVGHYKSGSKTTVRCATCRKSYSVDKEVYENQQEFVAPSSDLMDLRIGVSSAPRGDQKDPDLPLPPYLLGMALAEGNVRRLRNDATPSSGMKQRQRSPYGTHWKILGFDLTQKDGEVQEEIKHCLEREKIEYTEPSNLVIQVNDVRLARQMWALCGIGSSKKRLPIGWEKATDSWMLEVLAGLLDGDGTVENEKKLTATFCTTSWSLASQVMSLVGMLSGYSTSYATTIKDLTRNQGYAVAIKLPRRLPSVKPFNAVIPDVDDTAYPEVVQVKQVMYDDWTYDLATESRSFTANGVRTHNSFHTGGVVGAKGTGASGMFHRLEQLIEIPHILPGKATLARVSGKVDKVEKDSAGGWNVTVQGVGHYVPQSRELMVQRGAKLKTGDPLSSGDQDPRELLELTDMNRVQSYLTDEIWKVYKDEGPVRRRNVETFVRALTNLSSVKDPGSHSDLLEGDTVTTSEILAFNNKLTGNKKPVVLAPKLQGVKMLPLDMQSDWLARLQHQNLKSTVLDAAAEGWKSAVHGTHPIPGMAYGAEFGQGLPNEPWLY